MVTKNEFIKHDCVWHKRLYCNHKPIYSPLSDHRNQKCGKQMTQSRSQRKAWLRFSIYCISLQKSEVSSCGQTAVSSLCSGDESVQDVVCDPFRLRLGWRPVGLYAGQSWKTDAAHVIRSGIITVTKSELWVAHAVFEICLTLFRSSLLLSTLSFSLVWLVVSFLTPPRVTVAMTLTFTSPSSPCCSFSSTAAGLRSDNALRSLSHWNKS